LHTVFVSAHGVESTNSDRLVVQASGVVAAD
jgi:hypothetical protein